MAKRVAPYTRTSPESVRSMCASVEYLALNQIRGAIVECGVWKGGSLMAAALTLTRLGVNDRELYGFDTFAGMTEPTERDVRADGTRALDLYEPSAEGEANTWAAAPLDVATTALRSTRYTMERLHLVPGRVEDTIPDQAPEEIALLRLDTDWYESTRYELVHLYPRLAVGGVLSSTTTGSGRVPRKAVDEYFEGRYRPLFSRIDASERIGI